MFNGVFDVIVSGTSFKKMFCFGLLLFPIVLKYLRGCSVGDVPEASLELCV